MKYVERHALADPDAAARRIEAAQERVSGR
jgi:hypothetical protein